MKKNCSRNIAFLRGTIYKKVKFMLSTIILFSKFLNKILAEREPYLIDHKSVVKNANSFIR